MWVCMNHAASCQKVVLLHQKLTQVQLCVFLQESSVLLQEEELASDQSSEC